MTDYERRALERAVEDRLELISFVNSDEFGGWITDVDTVPATTFNRIAIDDIRDLTAILYRLRRGEDL